ncbi:MAG TPA: YncE family protein [Acidobacteriaceae bacterium]|nr:YncE family protein [Acidobacteriaceae bacterium]
MKLPMRDRNFRVPGLIAAIGLAAVLPAFAQKPFTIQDKWKIGGEGGWDYLTSDSAAKRLYITHGGRVEVIDSASGKSIGAITGLKGTHGVALDDAGKYGYISDGGANEVVVFDRATLQKVTSIPAGTNPDGIAFEPVTKTVWAFNGRSKDVTVIDTATQKVVATVALPGKPEFPVADGKGVVFDNIEDKNEIVRLDAKNPKITATWSVSPCESPSGLAIDREGRRLFAVCDEKKMAVVDANTGKVIATPAIGNGPDAASYDPKRKLAFSSNGEGTVTVVDASNGSYKVLQNLATQQGARTMTLDTATGRIYVVTAQFGPRPAATASNPRPRPAIIPDSFTVLVAGHE